MVAPTPGQEPPSPALSWHREVTAAFLPSFDAAVPSSGKKPEIKIENKQTVSLSGLATQDLHRRTPCCAGHLSHRGTVTAIVLAPSSHGSGYQIPRFPWTSSHTSQPPPSQPSCPRMEAVRDHVWPAPCPGGHGPSRGLPQAPKPRARHFPHLCPGRG